MATEIFPEEVKVFFNELGIDIRKVAEIMVWCSENNGQALYYGGFYHICGELLSRENFWKDSGEINMSEVYSITEGYRVGFSRQIALLEENFPNPVIQMEIDFHNVPWVLDIPDLSKHTNLQRIFLIDTGIDTKALPNDLQDKVCNWDDR